MRKADFYAQLIMAIGAITAVAVFPFNPAAAFFLLIIQFVIGVWQFLSCLLCVFGKTAMHRRKTHHLILSCIYLTLLAAISSDHFSLPEIFNYIVWTVPAWCLAFYYLFLSYQSAFPSAKKGSFLRNISF